LPFAEDSFNCITALDVIEHTADRPGTIKEISRVISTGGLLIVGAPVTDTTEGKIWGKYLDGDESHVSKPTRDEFFTDLENAGFEIKEFAYYFPLPFAKIPFPRTNMEIVAVKTDKTAEELRTIHEGRFNSPGFLKSQESVTSVA
jgi:SAM-dependent methyltransferase